MTPGRDGGATAVGGGAAGRRVVGRGLGRGFGRVGVALGRGGVAFGRVGGDAAVEWVPAAGGAGEDNRLAATGERSWLFELAHPLITHASVASNTTTPHWKRVVRTGARVMVDREMCSSHFPFWRRGG